MKTSKLFKSVCGRVVYFGILAILFMVLFAANARAYIDPSVISYLIQVVAGLAIGGMTVFGVYWAKIKRAVNEALNIDLEAKKEIESDDIKVNY